MKKIIHISDLHFGTEEKKIVDALVHDINSACPDLLIVSGDLTQRAKSEQYIAAAEFLEKINFPQIVVPGNHDISLWNIFRRFFRPLKKFRKYISDEEFPIYKDEEMIIVGINSARSLTIKSGRISIKQIEHLKNIFCGVPEPRFKGVVIHHNLIPSPEVKKHKMLGRSGLFIKELNDCGIDMMFSGHLHKGYSGDVQKFYKDANSIIAAQAGTATSNRVRGEENSYNLIEVKSEETIIKIMRFKNEKYFLDTAKSFKRENF
ncbi:MAG: metallophosphoesterase [Ignavibacteriae bacterium]|nr:metallophosphoesterase [Ignavibacteriota bacterium]NOG97931.1 metallophosphoesterase [Ignavibacteriota bacterium]